MKAHHGVLALLFSFACTSTHSGKITGSDASGATGGQTSSPDAAYVCPCPGGNCPTLEVLDQVLATPGGPGPATRTPVPSTVEGAVPFSRMQIGCGLRLVYQEGGTDAGYGYAFDLTTGALVGASVFNDVAFSGCSLSEYRWGDTSLFRMYLQGGMNCPDKIQCMANGDPAVYANWTCPSPLVDAGFEAVRDAASPAADVAADAGLAADAPADGPPADAQVLQGVFLATGSMIAARSGYTATLLQNGKVLFAGGYHAGQYLASAELYDPAVGKFTATGSMASASEAHTATLLPNGKVLIAGGSPDGTTDLASAKLYDPVTGTFAATVSMTAARSGHTATLLPNGKVLIAGGSHYTGQYFQPLASAELYDPSAGTFTATGSMTAPRDGHTATLLQNGKVLIVGGDISTTTAELYDPVAGTFAATGAPTVDEFRQRATLLSNGMVLIGGGLNPLSAAFPNEKRSELYDPNAGTFTATGSMTVMRGGPGVTLLSDGRVLVAGGRSDTSAEIYNPTSGTFTATGSMTVVRTGPTATLLGNGQVLVVGGNDFGSAELYQ